MKLRRILILFAVQTVILVCIGGYLYYDAMKDAALEEATRRCRTIATNLIRDLHGYLTRFEQPVRTLAGMEELQEALLRDSDPGALRRANRMLDRFTSSFGVNTCYLMNKQGRTIASSNRNEPDSFVGENFGFRPYFQHAISGRPDVYLALGTTSGERGAYSSYPVYSGKTGEILGVAVMKASVEYVESKLLSVDKGAFLVRDPNGIIFISNRQDWLFKSTAKLPEQKRRQIRDSQQFGNGPWPWIEWDIGGDRIQGPQGEAYLAYTRNLPNFPGWELVYMRSKQSILSTVQRPLVRILGPLVAGLCLLIGLYVFFLYTRASKELTRRRKAEDDLRRSERNYRYLYHNTPAMLHSIDTNYRLVQVSDFWLEATGYTRDEVLGHNLTDFFTPESKEHAEQTIFPYFFRTGFCRDVPYKLIRKDGSGMDILLTCNAIRDDSGEISRSLAISVDVTQRKREQEELQRAKEKLDQYSRELERLVNQRSQEIAGILRYTPAMIYLKNTDGTYRLINRRFREILALSEEDVSGRTDEDILPPDFAAQIAQNDRHVLQTRTAARFTERLELDDGCHTYLSIKFPIYDEEGRINALCGILTDITELQRAQNRLRNLSRNIIADQEREREAISRELHDELGQMLTALRMDCVWLVSHLEGHNKAARQRAATMRDHIDKTLDSVSRLSRELRPGVLDDLGLIDAVESLVSDYEKRTGMACIFEKMDVPELPKTESTAVYRIVQEALTNCVRHSRATQIVVSMCRENGHLFLEVRDNGIGLPRDRDFHGFGITGMQERAYIVGGELRITDSPEGGTSVVCRFPLGQGRPANTQQDNPQQGERL
ncbi:MAG: PAS domain-containing protein [Desulfohalobiaceae bacterium]|nr:PAS domain-containing protein [Desulfohalobiaceae bacterium]